MSSDLGRLFIYGTLIPGEERWPYLSEFVDTVEAGATRGLLYATPFGYPAALFDSTATLDRWIQGQVMTLNPEAVEECLSVLDEIESAVTGLFHRVVVRTASGVAAWSYQYGLGIDELEPIESGSWLMHQETHAE